MSEKNTNRWEPTKLQIDEIILPAYTDLSKRCVFYIKQLECPPRYIADMLRDLADAIMTSYPEVKNNSSCLLYTSPSPRDLSTSRMPSSA